MSSFSKYDICGPKRPPSKDEPEQRMSSGSRRKRESATVETAPSRGGGGGRARAFLKPEGMSLVMKFMLFVSGTIAVLMLVFGFVVHGASGAAT